MKNFIAAAILLISVNSYANSALEATGLAFFVSGSYATTYGTLKQEAAHIVNDSQDFFQTGEMSAFLSEKIANLKALDSSVSTEEALDALIVESIKVLN